MGMSVLNLGALLAHCHLKAGENDCAIEEQQEPGLKMAQYFSFYLKGELFRQ